MGAYKAIQLQEWGLLRQVETRADVWAIPRWVAEARATVEAEELQDKSRRHEARQVWASEAGKDGAAPLHAWIKERVLGHMDE